MKRISFLGAGSWGTSLAILCANNGHRVVLWSATNKFRKKREHVDCLSGTRLPDSVKIADDVEEACKDKDIIVVSVASPYMRSTARLMKPFVKPGQIVVNVAKGIEDKTLMTMCEILEDELPQADVAILSGPSHAEEISKGMPTTVVVGGRTEKTAVFIQDVFMANRLWNRLTPYCLKENRRMRHWRSLYCGSVPLSTSH